MTYHEFKSDLILDCYKSKLQKVKQFGIEFILNDFNINNRLTTEYYNTMLNCNVWGGINLCPNFMSSNYCVILGLKPSSLHLGHVSIIKEYVYHIGNGAIPFTIFGNYERLLEGFKQSQIDDQISTILDTFHKSKISNYTLINDCKSKHWNNWSSIVEKEINLKKVKQLYGWSDDISFSVIKIVANMVVSFLSPQLYLDKPMKTIIPCGENELPSLELTKIVAKKIGLIPPSISLRLLLPSLHGGGRMSTKNKDSTILFSDTANEVKAKLMKALTGGREYTLHKKIGGNIKECIFLQSISLLSNNSNIITKIISECLNGKMCSECKVDFLISKDLVIENCLLL